MVTQCFKEQMFPSEIYLVETFLHSNIESKDSRFAQSYRWSEWEWATMNTNEIFWSWAITCLPLSRSSVSFAKIG